MNTFEYRHEASLGQSFVNGSYALGEVRHVVIGGHDILYRIGSASLDNSCCGNYGLSFALVIGERVEGRMATDDAQASSLVREISTDEALADSIRSALLKREAIDTVSFYLAPTA